MLTSLLLASLAGMAAAAPEGGEWPCFRGGPGLLARSPLVGDMRQPAVVWKHFVGVADTTLLLTPDGGAGDPASTAAWRRPLVLVSLLPASAPEAGDPRWGFSRPSALIAGRDQPIPQDTNATYDEVLPGVPGLQRLEFESGFSKPTVNGQWQPVVGRCLAWRDGAWEQVWQTGPLDMLFSALPLAGDFDGDGKPEVAILPWYELLILDARTGQIKDRCRFTEGRSYGYFGVHDLAGDGKSEFVVQADFSKHLDVLGYRAGKLSVLWQREIEADISNPQKIFRVHPRGVADFLGDGRREIATSLFNDTGDGRWHVMVFDGMTGAVKADLPDEHLQGVADVNGDRAAELLTVQTAGGGIPEVGTVRVRSLRGGAPTTLWERRDAAWETWDPPLPLNVNSGATLAQRDALCRVGAGGSWAVIRTPGPGPARVALRLLRWRDGGFSERAGIEGLRLRAVGLAPDGEMLVRANAGLGDAPPVSVAGGAVRALCCQPRAPQQSVPVVVREPGRRAATILVQGVDQELVAFGLTSAADAKTPAAEQPTGEAPAPAVQERWRFPGRGQTTNWPGDLKGPVVADLLGDGGRQVLYAGSAPGGCARLVAATLPAPGDPEADRARPRELWHHDFPAIPGTAPVWNTGGLILWQVGHLTDKRAQDVVVTVRRSMMHSEETYGLSGRDGHELWHRPRQISNRGCGGTPFALADFDADGLDDVASLHPSILYIMKGSTGENLVAKDCSWPGVPAQPVYWGLPVAGDFEGTGRASIFFATERWSMTGLIRADGSLAWWDALDKSPASWPAFGNFDGDGKLEALAWGYPDGIRCYDAATGKVRWRLDQPEAQTPAGCASGELMGSGRDVAVFSVGTKLYCVGQGRVLWQLGLPAWLGPPSIADVDGTGRAAIVVSGADGWVYVVR